MVRFRGVKSVVTVSLRAHVPGLKKSTSGKSTNIQESVTLAQILFKIVIGRLEIWGPMRTRKVYS